MGVFDSIRKGDRGLQNVLEGLTGRAARVATGVTWPIACDPDGDQGGFDILRGVSSPRHPHRYRSESADASGYELREHESMLTYDGPIEHRNRMRLRRVLWVEVLHRPAFDDGDTRLLRDEYDDATYWSDGNPDSYDGRYYPYMLGSDRVTGQRIELLWLRPAVVRIRQAEITDVDEIRTAGGGFLVSEFLGEVLRTIDLDELGRWAAAVEPFRETIRGTSVAGGVAGGAIRGAVDALASEREGIPNSRDDERRAERDHDGGLLGRVVDGLKDGAATGAGTAAVNALRAGKLGGLMKKALKVAERPPRDPGNDRALPTVVECSQAPSPELRSDPWLEIDEPALASEIGGLLGATVELIGHHVTAAWDVRQYAAGNGEVHVGLVAEPVAECAREVGNAKTVGRWTIGGDLGDPSRPGGDLCVGALGDVTLVVRLINAGNPLMAMRVATAICDDLDG